MIFDYLESILITDTSLFRTESMTSLLASWLFAVYSYFFRIVMTKQILVTMGNCFPEVGEILPSTFGIGQYFPNFGETISNSE